MRPEYDREDAERDRDESKDDFPGCREALSRARLKLFIAENLVEKLIVLADAAVECREMIVHSFESRNRDASKFCDLLAKFEVGRIRSVRLAFGFRTGGRHGLD